MTELCADIGWRSLNKYGEELCGDHVEVAARDGVTTVVLADGLGSGVKASILSTLTAKILSTLLAGGLGIEECVETVAATLPVCAVRGIAYSTFTVLRLSAGREAEIIQYDNPGVIWLRDGESRELPADEMTVGGKTVRRARVSLREGDVFLAFSDGAVHAGIGRALNFGWDRREIAAYMAPLCGVGYAAKTLAAILTDECARLYGGRPGDDTTVCALRLRRRAPVNLLVGPPAGRDDDARMLSLFFGKEGKHMICGGTTSTLAAAYLGRPLTPDLLYWDPEIPPTATIPGVDLVTEGIVTLRRVLQYARDCLADNREYPRWSVGKDGASRAARLLFEEATDLHLFVGKAVNPAHRDSDGGNGRQELVRELADCLQRMGKRVKVSFF